MSTSAIGEQFEATCRRNRSARAIVSLSDNVVSSFDDLRERCRLIRAAFDDLSIEPGSVIVSIVGNHPIFFSLLVACFDASVSLVPVGEATDVEAAAIIKAAGAASIITTRDFQLPETREAQIGAGVRICRLPDSPNAARYPQPHVLKLTSGSTDLPKATLSTERNLLTDTRNIAAGMGIRPDDVTLGVLPLSHAYAISNVVMPLLMHGTAVALRPSFSPGSFIRDVQSAGVTHFPGVPFMFEHLRSILPDRALPAALRLLVSAGAPIDLETVKWFRDHLDCKIHSFYGSSEAGGITFDESDDVRDTIDVGRPLPNVQVDIRDSEAGGVGRVFIRSEAVADGYANATAEDAAAFQHGGFLSSDLGYRDPSGRLVLTGRISPLINVAGRKVDPAEVERMLRTVADVTDARVIGVDSRMRGQELVAFVVRKSDALTAIAIRQHCAKSLSPYKIPRRFVFLDRLPVNARGKVDRMALESLAAQS